MISCLALAACDRAGDRALVTAGDTVLVKVDGEPITISMLEYLMEARGVTEDDTEGMRSLLDELIRIRAMANRAREEGISDRPGVRAERLVKDIEIQYVRYLEDYQRRNPVTEREIREAYERQLERAGDRRYQLETIAFDDQQAALEVLERLRGGKTTFDEQLRKADEAGRLARRTGWIDASQVPPDFADVLASMAAGEVADSLMTYQQQWLVVRVAETDAFKPPAFEEVREGIRRTLLRQRNEALIEEVYQAAEIEPVLPLDAADGPGD